MKRKNFIKKIGFIISAIIISLIIGTTGCYDPPDCEVYHTGDVTFYDRGPSWAWDGCYIEVDWANGAYNSTTFYSSKTYYDKAAGRADVYMEWEDADFFYWDYGYINLIECSHVDAYCTWSGKKSATIESAIIIENSGKVLKKDINSIEEYRKTIKK